MQFTPAQKFGLGDLFRVQRPAPAVITVTTPPAAVATISDPTPAAAVTTSAPAGLRAKAAANIEAIRTVRRIDADGRAATTEERQVLARWSAWGALPGVFDENDQSWSAARDELHGLLDDAEWDAARRTTINAHYTPQVIASAVWDAVQLLGFTGGFVLEPGCGSGNFLGLAPAGSNVVGVELDPVTARVAQLAHPTANVRCEGFETTPFPDDWFDLAIGNVPFADVTLHDAVHNRGRHSMHNHFIVKSLDLVRPGGLVAVLTSRFTMDSNGSKHREEMAAAADLLGAVRLPGGAMQATAGTRVVADIVILRKRAKRGSSPVEWMNAVPVDTADGPVTINEYFAARPEMILGTLGARNGQYHSTDVTVTAHEGPLGAHLRAALSTIVGRPLPEGDPDPEPEPEVEEVEAEAEVEAEVHVPEADNGELTVDQLFAELAEAVGDVDAPVELGGASGGRPRRKRNTRRAFIDARPAFEAATFDPALHQEGTILRTTDQGFQQVVYGMLVPFEPTSKKEVPELEALLDLRDTVLQVIGVQAGDDDDSRFAHVQAELNERYDAYVERFGPLNRYTKARTGRVDDNGDDKLRKVRPRMGGFTEDPAFYTVLALEHFDADDQVATKADIFSKRVVGPRVPRGSAGSPDEALSICLDELGRVDLARIAELLGTTTVDARDRLGDMVWELPTQGGGFETASQYLSGNVRVKLLQAQLAAEGDERWQGNVEALKQVVPADLGENEIDCRLGATWIDASDVALFITETLVDVNRRGWYGATPQVEYTKVNATWEVSIERHFRSGVLMTSTWGTPRADAVQLVQWSLNQSTATVYDQVSDGSGGTRQVVNPEETFKAREKQVALEDRFRAWVWEDAERARTIKDRYNHLFNSTVLPTFDGSHLTLPGLSMVYQPRPHQLDAVWRVLQSPTALLAHPVGAGKTLVGTCSAMEMRRLGMVNKPAFVVPNHMLEQFASDMMRLYPTGKILVPTAKDMTPGGRRHFVARCAMGDWDAVVLTHSAFEKISVSAATAEEFLTEAMAEYREAIDESKQRMTIKKLEKACARMEEKIKRLQAAEAKDDGVTFEATGIDYLVVDESQAMKNLPFATHIRSVGGEGSQRAADLELKLRYLRRKVGERVCSFMTATPIANTIAEMFVVQKYLQPDRLAEVGCESFDGWAATFGSTVTALELAPDGGSYRMHTRFAKFHNVPELVTMFREVADVLLPADLASTVPIPRLVGGKPETVIVTASDALTDYVTELVERAKAVRNREVSPKEDNMLTVCGDGRKAALDLRLVGRTPDPAGGKIAACAANVAEVYHDHAASEYADPNGETSRHRGAFQLVFCDLGTPRAGWNAYDQLRSELTLRGVPEHLIRFVHEANNARAKAELFAACRAGRVAVLVGSTDKMGIGTNVQTRLAALHHLDCPWRPDQIEQRDGRGLRQGNQNDAVHVYRYATEGSFDVYMWQTVERKANFIHQVMRGEVTSREVDDISEQALSYAEIKALATGNPLIMEKAGVDNEVARLHRLKQAHAADQRHLAYRLAEANNAEESADRTIAVCERGLATMVVPDEFEMIVDGETFTKRTDAGTALRERMQEAYKNGVPGEHVVLGQYAGLSVRVHVHIGYHDRDLILTIADTPTWRRYNRSEVSKIDEVGVCQVIEHEAASLTKRLEGAKSAKAAAVADQVAIRERHGMPFDQEPLLESMLRKQADLDQQLARMEEKEHAA